MSKLGCAVVALFMVVGPWMAGGGAAPAPALAQTTVTAITTDALNLRAGPSTSDRVILVIPAGTTVTLTGRQVSGFQSVHYAGRDGWASSAYLSIDQLTTATDITAVTTDALNLRTDPGSGGSVIAVMPAGTTVLLTGQSNNGYRSVYWHGQQGWAHSDYLVSASLAPATSATTTDQLNLRTGPGTSYPEMTVMPAGVQVALTGPSYNRYFPVAWNGQRGWAFGAYLLVNGAAPSPRLSMFRSSDDIAGQMRGSVAQAMDFARSHDADRLDEVERYVVEIYRLAPQVGFDPAILVAQSAHETGNWHSFWWTVLLNPAGLGITGNMPQDFDSQAFPNGTLAARAQIAHMHAEVYGSSRSLPGVLQGVDDTYYRVFDAGWAGTIRTINDLAGTWAVDPAYDDKLVRKSNLIFGGYDAGMVNAIIEQLQAVIADVI